jgi:hypothetical protein
MDVQRVKAEKRLKVFTEQGDHYPLELNSLWSLLMHLALSGALRNRSLIRYNPCHVFCAQL